MKTLIFPSFCVVLSCLFAPVNTYAADGTISFTGAIVEPTCTTKTDGGGDTAISCYSTDGNNDINIIDIINKGVVENKVATFSHAFSAKGNSPIVFINYN